MTTAAACSRLVTRATIRGGTIAKLTLNHAQTRNALSSSMLEQIQSNLTAIEKDRSVRVVILNATGPIFCSGHDLKEVRANFNSNRNSKGNGDADSPTNKNTSRNAALLELCSSVMHTIARMPQPVLAQVEGLATAAGCQLVASCDLAYASPDACFATPGVHLGLFCSTPAVALGRCVAKKHAMHMLLTGDPISAFEAEKIGLINAVIGNNGGDGNRCDEDTGGNSRLLDRAVLDIAARIASNSPRAIALGKPLFYEQLELPLDDAYRRTSEAMAEHMDYEEEVREGIDAFLTKREPSWFSSPPSSNK